MTATTYKKQRLKRSSSSPEPQRNFYLKHDKKYLFRFFYTINSTSNYSMIRFILTMTISTSQILSSNFFAFYNSRMFNYSSTISSLFGFFKYQSPLLLNNMDQNYKFWTEISIKFIPVFMVLIILKEKTRIFKGYFKLNFLKDIYAFYSSFFIWFLNGLVIHVCLYNVFCDNSLYSYKGGEVRGRAKRVKEMTELEKFRKFGDFQYIDSCDSLSNFDVACSVLSLGCLLYLNLVHAVLYQSENSMESDYFSTNNFWVQPVMMLYKVSLTIINLISFKSIHPFYFNIAHYGNFIFTLVLFFISCYQFCYTKFRAQMTFIVSLGLLLAQNLACFIPNVFSLGRHSYTFFFMLFSMIITTFSINQTHFLYKKLASLKSFGDFMEMKQHINCFDDMRKQIEKNDEWKLIINGMLDNHYSTTSKYKGKDYGFYDPKLKKHIKRDAVDQNIVSYSKFYLKEILKNNIRKYPNDRRYKIFYAEFVLRKFGNLQLAIFFLTQAEASFLSPYERFKVYYLRKEILTILREYNADNFKGKAIEIVTGVEEIFERAKNLMLKICMGNYGFWSYWSRNENFKIRPLFDRMKEILRMKAKCHRHWQKIKSYTKFNRLYLVYFYWFKKEFLHKRLNLSDDELQSLRTFVESYIVKEKTSLHSIPFNSFMFKSESAVVHISLAKRNIGTIVNCDTGIERLFGYKKETIIGENISCLMPEPISSYHNYMLKRLFKDDRRFCEKNQINSYGMNKDGFLVTLAIYVKSFCNYKGDFEVVALLKDVKSKQNEDLKMICDEHGTIFSMTRALQSKLDLLPSPKVGFHNLQNSILKDSENQFSTHTVPTAVANINQAIKVRKLLPNILAFCPLVAKCFNFSAKDQPKDKKFRKMETVMADFIFDLGCKELDRSGTVDSKTKYDSKSIGIYNLMVPKDQNFTMRLVENFTRRILDLLEFGYDRFTSNSGFLNQMVEIKEIPLDEPDESEPMSQSSKLSSFDGSNDFSKPTKVSKKTIRKVILKRLGSKRRSLMLKKKEVKVKKFPLEPEAKFVDIENLSKRNEFYPRFLKAKARILKSYFTETMLKILKEYAIKVKNHDDCYEFKAKIVAEEKLITNIGKYKILNFTSLVKRTQRDLEMSLESNTEVGLSEANSKVEYAHPDFSRFDLVEIKHDSFSLKKSKTKSPKLRKSRTISNIMMNRLAILGRIGTNPDNKATADSFHTAKISMLNESNVNEDLEFYGQFDKKVKKSRKKIIEFLKEKVNPFFKEARYSPIKKMKAIGTINSLFSIFFLLNILLNLVEFVAFDFTFRKLSLDYFTSRMKADLFVGDSMLIYNSFLDRREILDGEYDGFLAYERRKFGDVLALNLINEKEMMVELHKLMSEDSLRKILFEKKEKEMTTIIGYKEKGGGYETQNLSRFEITNKILFSFSNVINKTEMIDSRAASHGRRGDFRVVSKNERVTTKNQILFLKHTLLPRQLPHILNLTKNASSKTRLLQYLIKKYSLTIFYFKVILFVSSFLYTTFKINTILQNNLLILLSLTFITDETLKKILVKFSSIVEFFRSVNRELYNENKRMVSAKREDIIEFLQKKNASKKFERRRRINSQGFLKAKKASILTYFISSIGFSMLFTYSIKALNFRLNWLLYKDIRVCERLATDLSLVSSLSVCVKEKFRDKKFYDEELSKTCQNSFRLLSGKPEISNSKFWFFPTRQSSIQKYVLGFYFEDICKNITLNKKIKAKFKGKLKTEIEDICYSYASRSLESGLNGLKEHLKTLIGSTILNKKVHIMTKGERFDLDRTAFFVYDVMSQIYDKCELDIQANVENSVLLSFCGISFFVVLNLFFMYLLRNKVINVLGNSYKIYSEVFEDFIPQETILRDNNIRFKLKRAGIIKGGKK